MKHLSDFKNFNINEDVETPNIMILDSPCICPNSKFEYRWVVKLSKEDPLKSVMMVQIYHTTKNSNTDKDKWSGTPGQWYVGTLLNKEGYYGNSQLHDYILIDAGQNWGVKGLSDALEEVKTKLHID